MGSLGDGWLAEALETIGDEIADMSADLREAISELLRE